MNGRVTDIAIDPKDSGHILLATVGGLWSSLDTAKTWERVSDLNSMLAGVFSAVAFNPADSSEVFAAGGDSNRQTLDTASVQGANWHAGGPGLWRSTLGGAAGSWKHVDAHLEGGLTLDNLIVHRLLVASHSPNDIYLATDHGIYHGQRAAPSAGCFQWRLIGDRAWPCSDLVLDESSSTPAVFAGVFRPAGRPATGSEGIWRCDPAGCSRCSLSVAPLGGSIALGAYRNPMRLYASVEDVRSRDPAWQGSDLAGVLESSDGETWTTVPGGSLIMESTHYAGYNSRLLADPDTAGVIYIAGKHLYHCEHDTSWTISSDPNGESDSRAGLHDDQHCMAIGKFRGSRCLYVGSDGGLDRLEIPEHKGSDQVEWQSCDHGLDVTEFYDVAVQEGVPMAIVGGTQDNGAPVTFGNMTWLATADCDASSAALDAPNSCMFYEGCIDQPRVVTINHPIPSESQRVLNASAPLLSRPPVAAHPLYHGIAIAAGRDDQGHSAVMKRDSLGGWSLIAALPPTARVECLAISGADPRTTCYVGFTLADHGEVWSSTDGGATWASERRHVFPHCLPTRAVMDHNNAGHAYVSFGGETGGEVYVTADSGGTWQRLLPSVPLDSLSILGLAISPDDSNEVYAAIEVGVLKGTVAPGKKPSVRWEPFDTGLPNGVDVTSLAVNAETHHLVAGTLGYGAYECAIGRGSTYGDRVLVRDNVFDRGDSCSVVNKPNPEDPIIDSIRPTNSGGRDTLYRYNDTPGGLLNWWSSEDVRVTLPAADVSDSVWIVDPVTVESCPVATILAGNCPVAGEICDRAPVPGSTAEVFVQVHNTGTRAAHNVRVLALWTPHATAPPPLPDDFWRTTFPAHAMTCGPLAGGARWQFIGSKRSSTSFSILAEIAPDESRIVTFNWDVPPAADSPSFLVMVESDEDPIPDSVRQDSVVDCSVLVPKNHQIAMRSLNKLSSPTEAQPVFFTFDVESKRNRSWPSRLLISAASAPAGFGVVFVPSKGAQDSVSGDFREYNLERRLRLRRQGHGTLDLVHAQLLGARFGTVYLDTLTARASQFAVAVVRLPESRAQAAAAKFPWRFTVSAMRDSTVLGGNTYIVSRR